MIKKVNFVLVCTLMISMMLKIQASEETGLCYRILFDSKEKQEADIVQDVIETYQRLTRTVKKKNKGAMIRQHLDEFKQNDHDSVSFEHGLLTLIMGDGKGTLIEGEFSLIDCGVEIETSSWILEQLGW